MKEYLLIIKNEGGQASLSSNEHQQFLKACEVYIDDLTKAGKLISTQPLIREGIIISGSVGSFSETPYDGTKETQVGYYHILAESLDDATGIAKRNPEFAFIRGAKIEVRPVKMKEQSTGFVYPGKK